MRWKKDKKSWDKLIQLTFKEEDEGLTEEEEAYLKKLGKIFYTAFKKPNAYTKIIATSPDGVKYVFSSTKEVAEMMNIDTNSVAQIIRNRRTISKGPLKGYKLTGIKEEEI